jgi:Eco57I restriction-modification methylase
MLLLKSDFFNKAEKALRAQPSITDSLLKAKMFEAALMIVEDDRANSRLLGNVPYVKPILIKEISGQVSFKLTDKVAVLYNIEWALYLKGVGINDVTVITIDYCPATKNRCDVMGIKYAVMKDVKTKFDVVVGNPPYQSTTNKHFYKQFVKFSKTNAKVVALVVPSSFFKKAQNFKNLTAYKFLGVWFEKVQLTVSWFIWQEGYTGPCNVHTSTGAVIPLNGIKVAPTTNMDQFAFASKILANNYDGWKIEAGQLKRWEHDTSGNLDKNDPGVVYVRGGGRKGEDVDYVVTHSKFKSKLSGIGSHKVVMSGDTTTVAIGPVKYVKPEWGCGLKAFYITVKSKAEADRLIAYLESPFIKYIIPVLKGTSTKNSKKVFSYVPKIDLSRDWTNDEIYAHFNLTADEIKMFESVK